jgi:hypothetical protein
MSDAVSVLPVSIPESLSGDKLSGVEQIALFIAEPVRRTYALCSKRIIPCGKQGAMYVASKQALAQHYRRLTSGQL